MRTIYDNPGKDFQLLIRSTVRRDIEDLAAPLARSKPTLGRQFRHACTTGIFLPRKSAIRLPRLMFSRAFHLHPTCLGCLITLFGLSSVHHDVVSTCAMRCGCQRRRRL